MKAEVVATEVPFGEGPVWCPDGTLVITHVGPGLLRRIWPESGRTEVIAQCGGGANAAQLASDGGFVVTQNGGIDLAPFADTLGMSPDQVPSFEPGTPGLQRVLPTGEVVYLADRGFQAPNDLIVDEAGTLYFTDPPQPHSANMESSHSVGRLGSYTADGGVRLIADEFSYNNGIALSPDGRLLVVEARGLMWIGRDGEKDWLVETLPGEGPGDGFCFDQDGRIYVAQPMDQRICVLDASGKLQGAVDLSNGAAPTNCCFGGADHRTLFTTELVPGRVMAIEGLPTPGLPLTPWPVQ